MMSQSRYLVWFSAFLFVAAVLVRGDGSGEEEVEFYLTTRPNTDEGKAEYDKLVSYAKMPQYGTCWSGALRSLHNGCKELTEDLQARLALRFANCFLEKSGLPTRPCHDSEVIQDCVKASQADSNFFMSYVNFFTHTQNICFYISAETWNKLAENKVNKLLSASQTVTEQLDVATNQLHKASALQEDILDSQKNALTNSKELAEQNQRLNETIINSQIALINSFGELQRSAKETRMWIGDIADRLTRLQSVFIDEFTGFYSLIFYFVSAGGCFVLTATNRTAGARLWLFVLLIAVFFLERFNTQTRLAALETEIGGMPDSSTITRVLNDEAWLIRKFFWAAASGIIIYYAYTFTDLNAENGVIIRKILAQMETLRLLMPADRRLSVEPDGFLSPGIRSYGRPSLNNISFRVGPSIVSSPATRAGSVSRITPSREASNSASHRSNLPAVPEDNEDLVDSSSHRGGTPIRSGTESREMTPVRVDTPGVVRYNLRSGSIPHESPSSGGTRRRMREKTPEQNNVLLQTVLNDITNGSRLAGLINRAEDS